MALQNTRAYSLRGEDLSQAGSFVREYLWRSVVPASARPNTQTGVLVGSLTISNMLGTSVAPADALAGKVRVLVNRSTQFFMQVTGQLSAGTTSGSTITVTLPIPPRGMLFLPTTFYAASVVTLAADTTWPMPTIAGAASGTPPPTVGATSSLTFDLYVEP